MTTEQIFSNESLNRTEESVISDSLAWLFAFLLLCTSALNLVPLSLSFVPCMTNCKLKTVIRAEEWLTLTRQSRNCKWTSVGSEWFRRRTNMFVSLGANRPNESFERTEQKRCIDWDSPSLVCVTHNALQHWRVVSVCVKLRHVDSWFITNRIRYELMSHYYRSGVTDKRQGSRKDVFKEILCTKFTNK